MFKPVLNNEKMNVPTKFQFDLELKYCCNVVKTYKGRTMQSWPNDPPEGTWEDFWYVSTYCGYDIQKLHKLHKITRLFPC